MAYFWDSLQLLDRAVSNLSEFKTFVWKFRHISTKCVIFFKLNFSDDFITISNRIMGSALI